LLDNLKLKTKLIAAFSLVASFTIINSSIAAFLFSEVRNEITVITDGDINGIQQTLKISSVVKKIEIDLEKLISNSNKVKIDTYIDDLQSHWKYLLDTIKKLSKEKPIISASLSPEIDPISTHIEQIHYLAIVLDDLAYAKATSDEIHKSLIALQISLQNFFREEIDRSYKSSLIGRNKLVRYYTKSNTLSSKLLSAYNQSDNTELNILGRQALRLYREIAIDVNSLPSGSRYFSNAWLSQIKPMVVSDRSIFVERRQEKRLYGIVNTLIQQNLKITTSIDSKAIAIVRSLRESIKSQTDTLQKRLGYFTTTLILTSVICLASVAAIILLFVGNKIIAPMVMIKQAMSNIAAGNTKTFLPPAEKNEIGEMLKALSILKEYVAKVNKIAQHDGLTNLLNRRQFDILTESEIRRCRRENNQLSLLVCDIDYFKDYNDHYGHLAGDECLKICANTIRSHFSRATDQCFRYGGEEFAISIAGGKPNDAFAMAEELRKLIESHKLTHDFSSCSKVITISIGVISASPDHLANLKDLFSVADKALYDAKDSGRNRVTSIIL